VPSLEGDGENIWVKVQFKRITIYVCVVYIPPNSQREVFSTFYKKIESEFSFLSDKNILIFGDFNLHSSKYDENDLNYFKTLFNLQQFNQIFNCNERILDLVYSNMSSDCITVTREEHPLVPEDAYHPALDVDIILKYKTRYRDDIVTADPSNRVARWKFNRRNVPILESVLSDCSWS
jgi:hypothetical protein